MRRLRQYSKWADDQTEDYGDEPFLYNMGKVLVLQVVPMMIMVAMLMVTLAVVAVVTIRVLFWVWNVVWI